MPTSLEKELSRYIGTLPKEALKEVVDFARNLSKRYDVADKQNNLQSTLYTLSSDEASHLEEEFVDYRKIYPHE
jgi:hypothetical protein